MRVGRVINATAKLMGWQIVLWRASTILRPAGRDRTPRVRALGGEIRGGTTVMNVKSKIKTTVYTTWTALCF